MQSAEFPYSPSRLYNTNKELFDEDSKWRKNDQ